MNFEINQWLNVHPVQWLQSRITEWPHLQLMTQLIAGFVVFFSMVLLIGGITRVVEVQDSDLSLSWRRLLSLVHIIGVVEMSAVLFVTGLDFHQHLQHATFPFFFSAILLLFPLHIFLGLRRRARLRSQMDPNPPSPRAKS